MADITDDELLEGLGIDLSDAPKGKYTAREERIIAGFEDILRFHQTHGRAPQHGEDRDIFERLYAVRLDRIRDLPEAQELLSELDAAGLLGKPERLPGLDPDQLDDDALLAALGADADDVDESDITKLRHVRSNEDRRAAEEIATRTPCLGFSRFRPLFDQVRTDIANGTRETRPYVGTDPIEKGRFYITGGQIAYIAEMANLARNENGHWDGRMRVIYDNGTENNLLMRSLQRSMTQDDTARSVSDLTPGPLFGNRADADDVQDGTIYVLRSKSDHPLVAQHRSLIHKIGMTGGTVEARIAGASKSPTYLMADVEVVATYQIYNLSCSRLETVLHRVFDQSRLDVTIRDSVGQPFRPQEWFLTPLSVIDEVISRIQDGSIDRFAYDPTSATLKEIPR